MATYNDLSPACYYVIQENEHAGLELVFVPMVSEKCVLLEYQDEEQSLVWQRKTDAIFEIVDQLTEEQAVIYESLFEDDEEEDFDWNEEAEADEWFDEDDEDDEDGIRASHN